MKGVIILIAGEGQELKEDIFSLIAPFLTEKHIETDPPQVIKAKKAARLSIKNDFSDDSELYALQTELADRLETYQTDVAILPESGRRKKLLIADMDSTVIEQECIDELADFVGLKDRVAEITERAMRGGADFKAALRERVALLKGLPVSDMETCLHTRITLTPGVQELTADMRSHSGRCVLVSGGFSFFTGHIREKAGFDEDRSNILEIENGALTGAVREPILDRHAKKRFLQEFAEQYGLSLQDCVAVGDGANDLDMIKTAGLGVAFHAKPAVAAEARVRINHAALDALIYLQS